MSEELHFGGPTLHTSCQQRGSGSNSPKQDGDIIHGNFLQEIVLGITHLNEEGNRSSLSPFGGEMNSELPGIMAAVKILEFGSPALPAAPTALMAMSLSDKLPPFSLAC